VLFLPPYFFGSEICAEFIKVHYQKLVAQRSQHKAEKDGLGLHISARTSDLLSEHQDISRLQGLPPVTDGMGPGGFAGVCGSGQFPRALR